MKNKSILTIVFISLLVVLACFVSSKQSKKISNVETEMPTSTDAKTLVFLSDTDWKQRLTSGQYAVLKKAGTETPFSSPLVKEKRKGTYVTADCGEIVFRSEQKFETGTGWPSFYAPINPSSVTEKADESSGEMRTEIVSPICKSHLGHVFHDAPQTPTGLRYCINGLALVFIPDQVQ